MQAETPEPLPEPRPRRRIPRPLLIAALAGAGVLIALAATRPLGGEPLPSFFAVGSAVPGLALGAIAPGTAPDPDAAQYTLLSTDGTPIALSDYAGHPLWLVFWKADCPPCEAEAADVQAAYATHHGDGLVVIGIDVWDSAAAANDYLADHPTPYPVAVDPSGAFMSRYGLWGAPTHYFVDPDGLIQYRYFGPLTTEIINDGLDRIL